MMTLHVLNIEIRNIALHCKYAFTLSVMAGWNSQHSSASSSRLHRIPWVQWVSFRSSIVDLRNTFIFLFLRSFPFICVYFICIIFFLYQYLVYTSVSRVWRLWKSKMLLCRVSYRFQSFGPLVCFVCLIYFRFQSVSQWLPCVLGAPITTLNSSKISISKINLHYHNHSHQSLTNKVIY